MLQAPMILKSPITLPIALLVFLSLLTFWINQTVQEQSARMSIQNRHDPDYMLYHFVTTRTDAQGHTSYALAATEMRHYPDHDVTELERPRFTQFGEKGTYLQIQGQQGTVSANGKEVEFRHQVKVNRKSEIADKDMVLTTERLTIEPDSGTAHTDLPVVIHQKPATVINANGMTFNNQTNITQFFRRVHVHYARATPPATAAAAVKPRAAAKAANARK